MVAIGGRSCKFSPLPLNHLPLRSKHWPMKSKIAVTGVRHLIHKILLYKYEVWTLTQVQKILMWGLKNCVVESPVHAATHQNKWMIHPNMSDVYWSNFQEHKLFRRTILHKIVCFNITLRLIVCSKEKCQLTCIQQRIENNSTRATTKIIKCIDWAKWI